MFATSNGNAGDPFNSEMVREAWSSFSVSAPISEGAPYCTQCKWEQTTVNIGDPEIRCYFRAAGAAFFDRRSLRLLSDWSYTWAPPCVTISPCCPD